MMRRLNITASLLAVLVVTACSQETKEDLGLVKSAPDEFAVVTRAPLSVPPDYALRPPRPGAERPMEMSTTDTARQTVFGENDVNGGAQPSESFLDRVGATKSDPSIRQVVDSEVATTAEDNRTTADKLMFWRDGKAAAQGQPIDPMVERQRLEDEGITTIKKRNEDVEAP